MTIQGSGGVPPPITNSWLHVCFECVLVNFSHVTVATTRVYQQTGSYHGGRVVPVDSSLVPVG